MTDTTTPANNGMPQLDGNVLFYSQPEPLSFETHGTLGVNALDKPYAFVGASHVVPITVTEFAPGALSYPIVFLGETKQPCAVMGLRQGENLYVTPAGDFRPEAYIPAYVRRYPFVFANDADQGLALCAQRIELLDGAGASEGQQVPGIQRIRLQPGRVQ